MSRRNSRSLFSSPGAQSPVPEMSTVGGREKEEKDDKMSQRRNKIFCRIQMDIKVKHMLGRLQDQSFKFRIEIVKGRKWMPWKLSPMLMLRETLLQKWEKGI